MKKEDFQKLKAIVEDNGFVMLNESENENEKFGFIGLKKYPWEGVDFAECIDNRNSDYFDVGEIYPVEYYLDECLMPSFNNTPCEMGVYKKHWKPSTEQAYIEQLKNECFERFGEIKRGELFDRGHIDSMSDFPAIVKIYSTVFSYNKKYDILELGNSVIYEKGKWAKRVGYVNVQFVDDSFDDFGDFEEHGFVFKIPKFKIKPEDKIGEYLAKKLEKYLNNQTK